MDESRLDEDLKTLSKDPRPDLPGDFTDAVWSKIRRRENAVPEKRENWFRALLSAFPTPQWAIIGLALAILAGWSIERMTRNSGSIGRETRFPGTVTGEVIDIACYFEKGSCGPKHADCAAMCIASGLPVGIKTKDGTVYLLIGKEIPTGLSPGPRHETLNAELAPYAAKIVTVSGLVVVKEGLSVIENAEVQSKVALGQQDPDRTVDSITHFTHFL
jgi:hypothetical protein